MNSFILQALSVAVVVAALLTLTRRGGTLLAGLATAALSAPTLVLLAAHEGADFALHAAVGTLLSAPACLVVCALGLRWLSKRPALFAQPRRGALWQPALLAGLVSALVCAGARDLGALGSGFVGGLPIVAAWTTFGTWRHSGGGAAAHYVRSYRRGLWLRTVMVSVFGVTLLPFGPAWATVLAIAASGLAIVAAASVTPRKPAIALTLGRGASGDNP